MSQDGSPPSGPSMDSPPVPPVKPRRSAWFYIQRVGGGVLLLLVLMVGGLFFYASTPQFANKVKRKVIEVLDRSTGGRAELQSFHWSILHLSVEADNLTIHGLEGAGEAPYLHVDRFYARARILSFLSPKIALTYLEADRPAFHLIVYPGGATNQPRPQIEKKNSSSLVDTIFNLQVQRTEIHDGLAVVNQRAIPFNLAARDLGVVVTYARASDRYLGHVRIADLDFQRGSRAALASKLALEIELARNSAEVKALHFSSGNSQLDASGSLNNFADPHWSLFTEGSIDLGEISALTGIDDLRQGTADLNLEGEGAGTGQFSLGGNVRLVNAGYQASYLAIGGVNATMRLRMTPDEITLDGLNARLREGGSVDAVVRFLHWNAWNAPAVSAGEKITRPRPPASRTRNRAPAIIKPAATIRARVRGIRLPSILRMVAVRQYQNLGFDTAADGTVNVDWTGSGEDLTVAAKVRLSAPRAPARGLLPLSGMADATYFERGGKVQIYQFQGHTPGTDVRASGEIAVYPLTGASALDVHLSTGNLGEFDHVLSDLGLTLHGKTGVAAIPVQLHGEAEFGGSVTGSLINPDVKGHLTATNFSTELSLPAPSASPLPLTPVSAVASGPKPSPSNAPPSGTSAGRGIHWDRLDVTGEVSSAQILIQKATISGGGAKIQAHGGIAGSPPSSRRDVFHAFDNSSTIDATATIQQASLTDLLAIAGKSVPVTGMVNLQVHAGGTLGDLTGDGNFSVQGGEIAGEPYHSIVADWKFAGHQLNLEKLTLLQNGGTAVANGTYDLETKSFLANLDATHFELAHFHWLQSAGLPLAGSLKFDAHASGTLQSPSILAGVHLTGLTVRGQPAGGIEAFIHTQGDLASFTAHSTLVAARLDLSGQTVLRGNFETKTKLAIAGLDIDPFLKTFNVGDLAGHSRITGTVDLSGPAKDPKEFSGDAELSQLSVTLENITLNSQGPLRASLRDGVVRVTQAHITGPDTDMTVTGTAALSGNQALDLNGGGSISMKMAQTFDPDITASGHVDFNVVAGGTLWQPSLTGQVRLTNVAMALNDVPNGISQLNGTLVFDQDRLEVQNLVGQTGGGQLKLGGFITYQQGIYGDLTATGKDVRIRYSGISATADTTLHLQGSETNMLLSGNVQITRFIIGPNVDFAVFTGPSVPAPPPSPDAPSNHVRLDIRITSSPQLDFQNSYAQLAGSVDLRIRGTVAQPALLGRINITEGTANFAGTTYQLQHGDIYFTNPVHIEPIIDIDATTRIQEYDVTIGLHGSANHLSPTFRSEPPLPQADVISLLALGRTQQEQLLYSQQEQQAGVDSTTNALLGGALNATVGNRVQRLFGVGSVKIDPTYLGNLGNSTARITVQQNISRNVQLTYATNVNTTAEQLIQAQINLTQNVSLLAVRDESDVFSVVMKVHKRLR